MTNIESSHSHLRSLTDFVWLKQMSHSRPKSAHMSSILCSRRHEPDNRVISSAYSREPAYWLPIPCAECLKHLIKSSTYIENNIGDKTPPCLTPHSIEKLCPRILFHKTDCVQHIILQKFTNQNICNEMVAPFFAPPCNRPTTAEYSLYCVYCVTVTHHNRVSTLSVRFVQLIPSSRTLDCSMVFFLVVFFQLTF